MSTEATHPPTGDPSFALVLSRLAGAFTAVSALMDAVDTLPPRRALRLRPSTSSAFGALTETEDVCQRIASGS
jgi:hypothetical protein